MALRKPNSRFIKMLNFLHEKEKAGLSFSVTEMMVATGYKEASIKTYITKRLLDYLVFKEKNSRYIVKGALSVEIDAFSRHMSQKSHFPAASKKDISSRLLERSLDSYLLAIELYNRPTQRNRIEAFCILLVNAWELLLKSEIVRQDNEKALYYPNDESRSLSITDAVIRRFPKTNDPVRKNLEVVIVLRDQAVHLLLPEINKELSRLFQACVINYYNRYVQASGSRPVEMRGPGIISIVVDGDDSELVVIRKKYGDETANALSAFLRDIKQTEVSLNAGEFSIPIGYKVSLTKKPQDSDIVISSGSNGEHVITIEIPRDMNRTHPHLQKDVIAELKKRLPKNKASEVNQYSIQALFFKNKIKSNNSSQYHQLIEKPKTHKFSDDLIDMLENKIDQHQNYIKNCVESYKEHNKKARLERK